MSPPRWLHWPEISSELLLMNGTFDAAFGSGASDSNPTFTIPSTFLTDYSSFSVFGVRAGATEGVQWIFANSADCLQFVSDYPDDGSIDFSLTLDYFGNTYTTIPGWSWLLTNSDTRAKIVFDATNWDSIDSIGTFINGTNYSIQAV